MANLRRNATHQLTSRLARHFHTIAVEGFDAATMAFDRVNWKIGDYRVELIKIDDESDPEKGTRAYEEAIVRDKKRLIPCAAYCDREYGVGGYYVGVPVVLGSGGVERIIDAPSAIRRSASPRLVAPQTNGTVKAHLLMWLVSSAGVSTSDSSM